MAIHGGCRRDRGPHPADFGHVGARQDTRRFRKREPIGVVGAIIAGIFRFCWRPGKPLRRSPPLHGRVKPAEETPLTALRLGELDHGGGLPKGVFNVVTGLGPTAGRRWPLMTMWTRSPHGLDRGRQAHRARRRGHMKKVTVETRRQVAHHRARRRGLDPGHCGAAGAIFFNQGQVCARVALFVARKHFDA